MMSAHEPDADDYCARLGVAIASGDAAAVEALLASDDYQRRLHAAGGMLNAPLVPYAPNGARTRCHVLAWAIACLQAQPLHADTRGREAIVTLLDRALPESIHFGYRGLSDATSPLALALDLTGAAPRTLIAAAYNWRECPMLPRTQRGAVAMRTWACFFFAAGESPYMRRRDHSGLVLHAVGAGCLDVARWCLGTAGWRAPPETMLAALTAFGASDAFGLIMGGVVDAEGTEADHRFVEGAVRELLRLTAASRQEFTRAPARAVVVETWAGCLCVAHATLGWPSIQRTLEELRACHPAYVADPRTRALAEAACARQVQALLAERSARGIDMPLASARLRAHWRLCLWLHGQARADWAARMQALARLSRRVPLFQNTALVEQELLGGDHAAAPPAPPPDELAEGVQLALAPQMQPMPPLAPPRVAWPRASFSLGV